MSEARSKSSLKNSTKKSYSNIFNELDFFKMRCTELEETIARSDIQMKKMLMDLRSLEQKNALNSKVSL